MKSLEKLETLHTCRGPGNSFTPQQPDPGSEEEHRVCQFRLRSPQGPWRELKRDKQERSPYLPPYRFLSIQCKDNDMKSIPQAVLLDMDRITVQVLSV